MPLNLAPALPLPYAPQPYLCTAPAHASQTCPYTAPTHAPQPCPYTAPAHAPQTPLNLAPALPLPMPFQLNPALPMPLPLPMNIDPVFTSFFQSARAAFIGSSICLEIALRNKWTYFSMIRIVLEIAFIHHSSISSLLCVRKTRKSMLFLCFIIPMAILDLKQKE